MRDLPRAFQIALIRCACMHTVVHRSLSLSFTDLKSLKESKQQCVCFVYGQDDGEPVPEPVPEPVSVSHTDHRTDGHTESFTLREKHTENGHRRKIKAESQTELLSFFLFSLTPLLCSPLNNTTTTTTEEDQHNNRRRTTNQRNNGFV